MKIIKPEPPKKFISDFHEPFTEVDGVKFNYLCKDKKHGQYFAVQKGNFQWEFLITPSGSKMKCWRAK